MGEFKDGLGVQLPDPKAKKAAKKNAKREALILGAVLDASINEVFMFDVKTLKFIQVNEGARRNLGYSMEELREMTPLSFKPKFTQEQFEALIAPLNSGEAEKIDFVTVHKRKDGSIYPVEVHLQRSKIDEQDIFLAVILDITNRTETQAALEQAQRFLHSAPDPTIIVNDEGIIQYASAQTEALLGYGVHELLGTNVDRLVPTQHRGRHAAHRQEFKKSPKNRQMGDGGTLFAQAKDGRDIPVEVSLSPIQTSEGLLVSASLRDITARIEAEYLIREARDIAEAATQAKSRFLAAASHDLRQPLQSLGLYLSTLKMLAKEPKVLEVAQNMETSLGGMADLLETLLDVSKLESGSIEPEKNTFSAQSLINAAAADYTPIARSKGLELTWVKTPHYIYSDLGLLARILENFVSNAIRYTDKGTVSILCQKEGDQLRLSVKDTGIGIPKEAQGKIFDEYYQLGNAHREQGKGLGLGLSVVKHIAVLLGHELDVKSIKDRGSTFSVLVPISEKHDVIKIPTRKPDKVKTPDELPTILCIDDNPAVLDSLTMLLDAMGYDLFSAGDGPEAMAHIEAGLIPDFIISDYRLPGDNGVEVITKLRQQLPDVTPAIILSGDTSTIEVRDSGLKHVKAMSKPVDVKKLLALIEQMAT